MTHEMMMLVARWNDMLTGGMMFQVGGMMCKVVALLLQMAENHLNLPTQRPIFHTHTLFIILLLLFILTMWKNRETLNMEPEHFQALIFILIQNF